jgi:hypothetical protein
MPHKFQAHGFFATATCAFCGASSWGIRKNFYQCDYCKKAACKNCAKTVTTACPDDPTALATSSNAAAAKKPADALKLPEGISPLEVHEFYRLYVKRDKTGEMVVSGLPPEYKAVFRESGIRPSELRDPMTAIVLMKALKQALEVLSQQPQRHVEEDEDDEEQDEHTILPVIARYVALYSYEAQSDTDISFWQGDIIDIVHKYDDGWFVGRPIGFGYPAPLDANGHRRGEVGTLPANYLLELSMEPTIAPPSPPANAVARSEPDLGSLAQSMNLALSTSTADEPTPTTVVDAQYATPDDQQQHEASSSADTTPTPTPTTPSLGASNSVAENTPAAVATPSNAEAGAPNIPLLPIHAARTPAVPATPTTASPSTPTINSNAPAPPPPPPPQAKAFDNKLKIPTRSKESTKNAAPAKPPVDDLFDAIKKGANLRHVDPNAAKRDVKELNATERTCLLDIMRGVMEERRKAIGDALESTNRLSDGEDEWSD